MLRTKNLYLTLLTLDDLVKSCFIDRNNDIHLFNTSYIDICGDSKRCLQSIGFLIYQILGGKLDVSQENLRISSKCLDDLTSFAWIEYVNICCTSNSIEFKDFYSPFVLQTFPLIENDSEETLSNPYVKEEIAKTLRAKINSNDLGESEKAEIILKLMKHIKRIIRLARNQKLSDTILSPDSLTIDTIGVTNSLEIYIINFQSFFTKNDSDYHLIAGCQIMNRLGYLIYQLFSNEILDNIPEYNENVAFPINNELPLFVTRSFHFCLYDTEYYQQKIRSLMKERQRYTSLSVILENYPFIILSYSQKHKLVQQILEKLGTNMQDTFYLGDPCVTSEDITVDENYNFITIYRHGFEDEKILEKELAVIIYELFSNKRLGKEEFDMKGFPKFVQKFIKLCYTDIEHFYVPFDKLLSSWKKQRLSKRQKAVLYAMNNQHEVVPLRNLRFIGKGSSGKVFQMEDQTKAIKVYDLESKTIYGSCFISEIKNFIFFKNQNVVNIHGVMVYPQIIGIVMDYLPKILSNIINDENPLSHKEVINYCLQIAEALKFIHSKGVIHRDLKPQNIGFDHEGNIKLFDFETFKKESIEMTEVFGTPEFMAPEQFEPDGSNISKKIDVYAYGLIVLLLFGGKIQTGLPPFVIMTRKMKGENPTIPPNVPKYLAKMILKCWSLDPNQRPSFDEIVEILKSSKHDSDFKIDSFDWSQKEGIIDYNKKPLNYKIFPVDEKQRIQIKNTLDGILLSGSNLKRVEDYCFKDDEILIIYSENANKSLLEYIESLRMDQRLDLVVDNIEFMITTLDMLHAKGLLHQRMDPASLTVTEHGMICFGDICIPGVGDDSCGYIDQFDAPEIRETHKHTVKSNIYSFAALIAFILGGDSIFKEDGTININKVNKSFRSSIRTCLNTDPNKRPDFQTLYKIMFPTKYQCYSQCIDQSNTRFSIFQTIRFQVDDLVYEKLIGTGTSSNVYLATNKKTNTKVVVKECYFKGIKKLTFSPVYQELATLNVLKHQNLIRILGTITSRNATVKILMEYANKGDLATVMSSHPLSLKRFVEFLVGTGLGMCFMHSRDVIHRDLKPENILICGKKAVVSDFNSAAFVSDRGIPLVFGKHGTKNFMAPEMMLNYPLSYSCDVFSFGMVICSYFKVDINQIWNKLLKNEKVSLDFIENQDLRFLTQRCLEFDSSRRPTFDFICRYLIKKFKISKFDKDCLFPSRRDLSLIEQMRNEIMVGNYEHASDYGRHLMYEQKFEEAKKVFEKGCESGDCMNDFAMILYLEGKKSDSIKFFRKAAVLGNVYALVVMGIMRENPPLFDRNVESNMKAALYYYQKAAHEDANNRCSHLENPKAKYLEGLIYKSSNDIDKAIECFYTAALEFDGLNMMGLLIESKLVDEEEFCSEDYFRMAASQLNPSALLNLSRVLRERDHEASKYYEELSKFFGGSKVSEFRKSSDVLHESWDMHGQLCEIVRGLEVASELGNRKSQSKLRKMMINGYGIQKNEKNSKNLFEQFSLFQLTEHGQ